MAIINLGTGNKVMGICAREDGVLGVFIEHVNYQNPIGDKMWGPKTPIDVDKMLKKQNSAIMWFTSTKSVDVLMDFLNELKAQMEDSDITDISAKLKSIIEGGQS